MKDFQSNIPCEGKTYSLFGQSEDTDGYYEVIAALADRILEGMPDIAAVLTTLGSYSSPKRFLPRKRMDPLISSWLDLIDPRLEPYTQATVAHLKDLSFFRRIRDKRQGTTRQQHHLFMLEIELTNRLFRDAFRSCERRIALMPYCLQDFGVKCKAAKKGFDNQCSNCSPRCYLNQASTLLAVHDIEPYIWMDGDLKALAGSTLKEGQRLGVLGIACIPELAWGMRKCRKYSIPVVGIPLNANRCIRWFGEFFPNSINLNALHKLVAP